jgi:hypothetical protein
MYDGIFRTIQEASARGQQVILHCGAGHGRSGTTLAALKMRELIESTQGRILFAADGCVLPTNEKGASFNCSALITEAIKQIRATKAGGGNKCVEFKEELHNLEHYETYILGQYCNDPNPNIALAATQALIRYRVLTQADLTGLVSRRQDVAALIAPAVAAGRVRLETFAAAAAVDSGNPPKVDTVTTQQQVQSITQMDRDKSKVEKVKGGPTLGGVTEET